TAVKSSVTGYLRGLATFPTRRSSDLGQGDIAELGIRQHFTLGCYASSWHVASLFSSGLSGNWRIIAGPALLGSHRNRKSALGCLDRKSTRLNSSHVKISYAVFCLKKK